MSALTSQPENINGLTPIRFRFTMKRLPGVDYFTKNATLPSLTLGEPLVENMFVKLPIPGDKLTFEPYNIRFMVDEDMTNYMEIFNWLIGLGYPENFAQSIHKDPRAMIDSRQFDGTGTMSDATLMVMTSSNNPNVEVTFKDMFPISLSSLDFNVEETDIQYLVADATFAYRNFTIQTING